MNTEWQLMKTEYQLNSRIEQMSPQEVGRFISAIVFARYGVFAGHGWRLDQEAEEHKEMILDIEDTIEQFGLNPDSL